jgi:FkbM family methyltransferase
VAKLQNAVSDVLRSHRRLRTVAHAVARPIRRSAVPVLRGNGRGLRLRVGSSTIGHLLFRMEPTVEDAFLGLLRPGDVVYDIGANIGWYSLLAARKVGPGGKVIAFEPSVLNAAYLEQNAASNGLTNVTVICAAVTDRDGWATFLDRGSTEGRLDKDDCEAQAQRRAARAVDYKRSFTVPVLTLDSWIAETGEQPPNVLKIDVQGAEVGVLRGMTQTLRAAGPAVVLELHGTRSEVADELDSVEYEHAAIQSAGPTREAPWWAHVIARPRGARASSVSAAQHEATASTEEVGA